MRTSFVCFVLFLNAALAQVQSGTIIVFQFTGDKFVVAADSRSGPPKDYHRPPEDDYCKIAVFAHKFVFAASGTYAYRKGESDYAKGGKAKFAYNLCGLQTFTTEANQPIPAGKHQVRMEFGYDGGGLGKVGNVSPYYDGKKVGEGRVERAQPMIFSADETTDGRDTATPVSSDYTRKTSVFNGKVHWVQIDLGRDVHDHLITPEERLNLAMARQ